MWPNWISNSRPLTIVSDALPTAPRDRAFVLEEFLVSWIVLVEICSVLVSLCAAFVWRPVVAVYCNNSFLITDIIVRSDSIFWLNKLGVIFGITLI